MTAKLDYRWHLRDVMADRGMFSTTKLRPLLAERGIDLSSSQIYRLVTERPERLSLTVLMALLDILDCRMDDLIEPIPVAGQRRRKASGETQPVEGKDTGVGSFRPKRANIVPGATPRD
jgi:DNA-binding Xre family transcriptional regulator